MEINYKENVMESFNTIRTNIDFLRMDLDIKNILVTSSVKGEGKTFIACNIAKAYSQIKKKVLLVDCDLRNPSVHKVLEIAYGKGLAEMIIAGYETGTDHDYCEYIINYKDSLDVIISGIVPPNPSELLSSKRIEAIFNHFKEIYDVIILDTPPILLVSDALSLQKHMDGVLMVVKYGFTTNEMLRKSNQVFKVAGIKPMAYVFNAVPTNQKKYLYYNDYNYGVKIENHQPSYNDLSRMEKHHKKSI